MGRRGQADHRIDADEGDDRDHVGGSESADTSVDRAEAQSCHPNQDHDRNDRNERFEQLDHDSPEYRRGQGIPIDRLFVQNIGQHEGRNRVVEHLDDRENEKDERQLPVSDQAR